MGRSNGEGELAPAVEREVAGDGEEAERSRHLPCEGNAPQVGDIAAEQEPDGTPGRGHHAAEREHGRARVRGHLFVEPSQRQRFPCALEGVHEEEEHERLIGPAREKARPEERERFPCRGCAHWLHCLPAISSKAWEIERSPMFNGWLTAQRRRLRACHAAVLEQAVKTSIDDEVLPYLEKWLELAPFDQRVHELLLNALARQGRIREGEEHLAAASRLFEAEGLDCEPPRNAWRCARGQTDPQPRAGTAIPIAMAERDETTNVSRRASIAVSRPSVERSPSADPAGGIGDALADVGVANIQPL